jgi:serine/threonine-protein kinase
MIETGRVVGEKYRLQRMIGVGGMGTVYEAVHVVTQRRVALKVMHAHVLRNSMNGTKRFLKEARATASISHPGIVDVLDAGQEPDGSLYLALELLDGFDLQTAMTQRMITPLEGVQLCIEICAPLAAAHERGLIHRDIKPANIFVDRSKSERCVKLLDFGIVKERDDQITARGSLVGTIEYMSPEQAIGAPVDPRSDIWGLGATLFFVLAGRPPFRAEQQLELLHLIASTDAPPLSEVAPAAPPDLCAVVGKCLARRREDRYASVRELEAALLSCFEGETASIEPPGRRRPRSLRMAALLLAGMALGAAALALLLERNEPEPLAAPPARTRTILVREAVREPAPPPIASEPAPPLRKPERRTVPPPKRGRYDPMRAYE